MNLHPLFSRSARLGWAMILVVALAALLLAINQSPPAQASLYWASANGVTPLNSGVRSATPSLCFVGNAVTARPQRVTQIVQYLTAFENVSNLSFVSPVSGKSLDAEVAPGGNINNLKCPASAPSGGKDVFAGDLRLVLPNTDVIATDPVPGLGCFTDKFDTAPDCVALNASDVYCVARGVNHAAWIKHYPDANGNWGGWDSETLGGVFTSGLTIASLGSSNLEVVGRGQDNNLWVNTWNGSWSGFALIPGTAGNAASEPDCVGHDVHHLTCAVRWSDNSIRMADRASGVWGAWINTGLTATAGPTITSWGSGRLDVFTRGPLNGSQYNLTHVWSLNYGATWTAVENLGGNIAGAPDCVGRGTSGGDGTIACFARVPDGTTWERSYPGGSVWNAWTSIGGYASSDPTVESRSASLMSVYVMGGNGALWQTSATIADQPSPAQPNGGIGSWQYLGDNNGWGSWSTPPWMRYDPYYQACQYNLKLGDDPGCPVNGEYYPCASNPEAKPYLNHTLHEVGHALGLAHEQARSDATVTGCGVGYGGVISAGFITPYDRDSVMHYQYLSCGINGNYDNTGLSYYDQLAMHILYPPADYPAEITGNLGIKLGQTLNLSSAWKSWGATMSFVANTFVWKVDGITRSTTPDLSWPGLTAGSHSVTLDYDDFLGRHHASSWQVKVFTPAQATSNAVQGGALSTIYAPVYLEVLLPAVSR